VATIPTAVIGFLLYSIIKDVFLESASLQIGMFIAIGIAFILFERFSSHSFNRPIESITYKEAFIVGIAQSLAIIPGVSRAGAVLLALMALGTTRKDAAVFSFLLAVPTILGASVLDIVKSREAITSNTDIQLLLIGSLAAFVTAYAGVQWLLKYLESHTLHAFGWYRIIIGCILLFFMAT
jgi:undecaprenyl-diphosphatase